MADWTTPRTWVQGELVTPALMNEHVRDNLTHLNDNLTNLDETKVDTTTADATYLAKLTTLSTTNAAANVTVLNNAIADLPVTGGTLRLPAGTFPFDGLINMNGKIGLTLEAEGPQGGAAKGVSVLQYTGTTGDQFVDARDTNALKMSGVFITHTSALFTGRLLDLRGAYQPKVENTKLGGASGVETSICMDLDGAIIGSFKEAEFQFYDIGVQGSDPAGSNFSTSMVFDACHWGRGNLTHMRDAGAGWTAVGCTFSNHTGGLSRAYGASRKTAASGTLALVACWAGDVTAGTRAQIEHDLRALVVHGGTWGIGPGKFIQWTQNGTNATEVAGARIQGDGTGTIYDLGATTGQGGIDVGPNSYSGVGTMWSTVPPQGSRIDTAGEYDLHNPRFTPSNGYYHREVDAAGVTRRQMSDAVQEDWFTAAAVLRMRLQAGSLLSFDTGGMIVGTGDAQNLSLRTDATERWRVTSGNGDLTAPAHAFDTNRIILGSNYLWVDATGKLRIKGSAPTSDTDGTVVGTQT